MAYFPARVIMGTLHRNLDKTASYTVTANDLSRTITNQGATGTITVTLPAITGVPDGFWVRVAVLESQQITLAVTSGELVTPGSTGSSQVTNSTVGSVYEVQAHAASGNWIGMALVGTWSAS